ncbi:aldotetraouronic acid ABC transporter membrane protein 1 [Neobacillus bataviensis]|uniref:Aldotetraouronic acid ABC transporter membrane protein 1 n=2 Tax=Neobacillus bataviensis TaxID=220685 RepID=A0A561D5Z9_9BACI|nr:sugar ABC transporter permease [Neobacillus bataviensis]TWD98871.1 aldotetraouronic acid ABC transporter membrane protein 1 [Neobacillus bataviensis]
MQAETKVADELIQTSVSIQSNKKKGLFLKKLKTQKALMAMSIPFLIWLFVFKYVPLWGWSIAFQDYKPALGMFDQTWSGLKHFKFLFDDANFYRVLRNTLGMSVINLVLGFVTAIGLALLLNEIRHSKFKKIVQTISYMPHFLSWVVAASIISYSLSTDTGIVNIVLMKLGIIHQPILWLGKETWFWGINGVSDVWKNVGWNTIIYLAAITMIDPEQYEAADIDGATRLQRIRYITLPSLKPTIIILLIMNLGYILESGFEAQYLLGNPMNLDYSENLDIYVLKYGISMGNFSLATAAGIFKTVVSFIFLFTANHIAKKFDQPRLF